MEAAAQLLKLGHAPIIIEKGERLGGHVARWNRLFPDLTPAGKLIERLTEACKEANIFLNTEVSLVNRLRDGYNIVLSNGITISTKYILMTTGFKMFEASKKEEYGYGIYNNVVTNSDLENWFNGNRDERIDSSSMKTLGFVHCVGSRDEKAGNGQCSKVCCITAIKQSTAKFVSLTWEQGRVISLSPCMNISPRNANTTFRWKASRFVPTW